MAKEQALAHARSGWQEEERQLLWDEVTKAASSGNALRTAFDAVAAKTGRKPNSIRNFYYISVKNGGAPSGVPCQRALPFTPFDESELHELVRAVLLGRVQGKSVRACVGELGGGDRQLALRYQNKYRSMLKSRPEYIRAVIAELQEQGVTFGEDFTPVRRRKTVPPSESLCGAVLACGEPGAALLDALSALLQNTASACRAQLAAQTLRDETGC